MNHPANTREAPALYETPEWLDLHFEAKYEHRMRSAEMYDIRLGEKIADIGCGNGAWIDFFWKKLGGNGYILGIDPSGANIAAAKSRYSLSNSPNVRILQGDLETFCNNEEKYDVIHFGNSFGYIKNKTKIFGILAKKLRHGGRIILRQHDETTLLLAPVRQVLLETFKLNLAKSQDNPALQLPFDLYSGRNIQFDILSAEQYRFEMRLLPFEAMAPFASKTQEYILKTCKWILEMTRYNSTDEDQHEWEHGVVSKIQENKNFYFSEIEYLYHVYLRS